MAADIGLAVRGVEKRRQDLHRGRLPRPVRADEAEQVPRGQIELDRLDGVHVAIFFGQVYGFNHGVAAVEVTGFLGEMGITMR